MVPMVVLLVPLCLPPRLICVVTYYKYTIQYIHFDVEVRLTTFDITCCNILGSKRESQLDAQETDGAVAKVDRPVKV